MITHMDRDSAVQGIQELNEFFEFLSTFNPKLGRKIQQDQMLRFKLHALFSGLTPINKLAEGDWKTAEQIILALQAFGTPNVFCIIMDDCKKYNGRRFEFINRWAVHNVASMHPDIFPNPESVVDWLQQNTDALCHESIPIGDFGHVIYGILSGYPRSACETFLTFQQAKRYLYELGIKFPSFLKSGESVRSVYTTARVLEPLIDRQEYLWVMQNVESYGFGPFHCFVFNQQAKDYIDALERVYC